MIKSDLNTNVQSVTQFMIFAKASSNYPKFTHGGDSAPLIHSVEIFFISEAQKMAEKQLNDAKMLAQEKCLLQ